MSESTANRLRQLSRREVELAVEGGAPIKVVLRRLSPLELARLNLSDKLPMFRAIKEKEDGGEAPTAEEQAVMAQTMQDVICACLVEPRLFDDPADAEAHDGVTFGDLTPWIGKLFEEVTALNFGTAEERNAAGRFRGE